ncbi:DsbA family protein [Salipiger mucosus]|uniref:Thioredoxin-like fold domain-containing protein n=1 Tax=Salipiger mucosus DSM 16094 TaxID=1123237 RepID=S9QQQ6_9RHOB|nr:thioredoxin domain-containing protein [Salipiger mucosus]EPX83726.1 hypothetical protein Salmuc_03627 [Salipiger mucosus DSM 16094]
MQDHRKFNVIAFAISLAIGMSFALAVGIGLYFVILGKQTVSLDQPTAEDYVYQPTTAEARLADNGGDGYILIFGSVSCPHCRDLIVEDLPGIIERAPGKVVYRNVISPDFPVTALAQIMLSCMPEEKRGPAVRKVYENQDALFEESDRYVRDIFLESAGLDLEGKTADCLDDTSENRIMDLIDKHNEQRRIFDISATPTIVVDGETFVGRQDAESLGL